MGSESEKTQNMTVTSAYIMKAATDAMLYKIVSSLPMHFVKFSNGHVAVLTGAGVSVLIWVSRHIVKRTGDT